MKKFAISSEQSGTRIDKFLTREFFDIPRGEIIRQIKNARVLANGKAVKPSYSLKENDVIKASIESAKSGLQPNPNITLDTIHQNEHFVVINKPAGLKTHPVNLEETDTLVNALIARFPEIIGVGDDSTGSAFRPGIVHRLDRDTSGIIIVARHQQSFDELKKLFKERKMKKTYLAIASGNFKEKTGTIIKPLAKSTDYRKQVIAHRKTQTAIREAITEYQVLREVGNYSALEVRPKTGRTHQIRIHLASLGHPIVGDQLYGKKRHRQSPAPLQPKRHLLHAQTITFELFGQGYSFSAPLPPDFSAFLDAVDENKETR